MLCAHGHANKGSLTSLDFVEILEYKTTRTTYQFKSNNSQPLTGRSVCKVVFERKQCCHTCAEILYPGLKWHKIWECTATLLMSICRLLSHMGEGVMDLFACKSQTVMLKREQTHSTCACWPPRPTGDCSSKNCSFRESELSSTNDFHCSSASRSPKQ